ncbi:maleylpyruvate isomerase family mycothiol-dependent enzyme [Streptomyces colonosanans]|uniref:Mycothiol-dependent maleylpyruvate isomerase metal-binding domain-containing protein n=1 Tax=Streptomyces colonosanans TaxID=1428652 RepID=A0A1S2P756_9ACTN|nr:maleylpyruvate isomerase family mycothiol-dependent enzyme [Streptomyces colonosanans]OIJ89653.1 hypothetical protein BIV24_19925 [Streptomyces colonosanans]
MTMLTHDRYCDEIERQVGRLRKVAAVADLSVTVPTCPDWSLEQLVRHTAGALRWVELLVRTRAQENIPDERVPGFAGPRSASDLDAWLAESGETLVRTLRAAGPDAPVWSWTGHRDAGFWARRMSHELTIHRADATLAAGQSYEVAPDIAADALDEWLEIVEFFVRTQTRGERELVGPGRSIHLHATDTAPGLNAEWIVELTEDGVVWRRGHEKATVALRGPLTAVLLAFYRRLPLDSGELEVHGERELLEFWLQRASFG